MRTGTLVELINFNLPAGAGFLWPRMRTHSQVMIYGLGHIAAVSVVAISIRTQARSHRLSVAQLCSETSQTLARLQDRELTKMTTFFVEQSNPAAPPHDRTEDQDQSVSPCGMRSTSPRRLSSSSEGGFVSSTNASSSVCMMRSRRPTRASMRIPPASLKKQE
jgi:hypothetical protein